MNRRAALNYIGIAPLPFFISTTHALKGDLASSLIPRWEKSKTYTLDVFKAMPAESIEYTPSEDQMTFAQHYIHLGYFNNFFLGFMMDEVGFSDFEKIFQQDYLLKRPDNINLFNNATLEKRTDEENKEMIATYLAKTFDFVINTLKEINEGFLSQGIEKSKPFFLENHTNLDMILRADVHTAHHRAQTIVYLRLKGVKPPGFGI